MERYVGRCLALVISLSDRLPRSALDEAQHLIDHGEPAEGVRAIAWAVADTGDSVSSALRDEIRALTSGLVDEGHLPPQFRSSA
jgi:hypothetical protein